jgi:hypothetical protein
MGIKKKIFKAFLSIHPFIQSSIHPVACRALFHIIPHCGTGIAGNRDRYMVKRNKKQGFGS